MVKTFVAAAVVVALGAGPVFAQAQTQRPDDSEQVRARQRIATMRAVLQSAVLNGADNVLRRVSTGMPERPRLAGAVQVHGWRLEGYGVFFHVQVPDLVMPIMWPVWQMATDSQNRGLEMTLQRLRSELPLRQGEDRQRLQRMIRDLENELASAPPAAPAPGRVSAAALTAGAPLAPNATVDPDIIEDPEAAYTREVKAALIDAMLENSQALAVAPEEWLTVAAGDNLPRNPMSPGDTVDASTWIVRVKGSDLAALRAGSLTLEDTRARVVVSED